MSLEYSFLLPLSNGLHARPASRLAEIAGKYQSEIKFHNTRTDTVANAASVLDLVALGAIDGDPCKIIVSGIDEDAAFLSLVDFITDILPGCDEPVPSIEGWPDRCKVPRVIAGCDPPPCLVGLSANAGIGFGMIVREETAAINLTEEMTDSSGLEEEKRKLEHAIKTVTLDVENRLQQADTDVERDILRATLSMVKDRSFGDRTREYIEKGKSAAVSVADSVEEYAEKINGTESEYLRERIADLYEIGVALIERITGRLIAPPPLILAGPSIVVSRNMAPGRFLALDREMLKGIVLSDAGMTSHTIILARSLGIPAIVGVDSGEIERLPQDIGAVIDGTRGIVYAPMSPEAEKFYTRELSAIGNRHTRFEAGIAGFSVTKDGKKIEIAANIATVAEACAARERGAEGVGLFRTETLFFDDAIPPSESKQTHIYLEALQAMEGSPVIIRTLDAGGDKPIAYLNIPGESNPFLGYRGIRIYEDNPDLIDSQLRAIVSTSAKGNVKLMAPMVATVSEACWLRERVRKVQAELKEAGIAFDEAMQVGIMVEVPSIAFAIADLRGIVDFISIGTNDLCQYFFAADRGNEKVAELNNVLHPAFLRLLKTIVDTAKTAGIWVGLCGEMAGDVRNLPLLVGLGLDEISMSAPAIKQVRHELAQLVYADCRTLLDKACCCTTPEEVAGLLGKFSSEIREQTMISPELVRLDISCDTKVEAIHELCMVVYESGRTDDVDGLEDALWERETTFSTGLGHGFAIPHCKTDCIASNSIAILRLNNPIEWGSIDDAPVSFIIGLAIRKSDPADTHLRILARLARKLMDDGFRDKLKEFSSADGVVDFLAGELEIEPKEIGNA